MKRPSKTALIVTVGIVLILVGFVIWKIANARLESSKTTDHSQTSTTPPFKALLPTHTSIEKLGGWQKLTPPNNEPYYVYSDTIDNVPIKVSEQPLSQPFKADVEGRIAEVAKAYSATETFDADGTKVYIGINAKGQQSVIFTKNELLMLVVSEGEITHDAWKSYIKSLS